MVGILIETISEIQRAQFKKDPANAGKPYSGGLFGWARNINYGGYLVWRTGYALVAGGPVWGLIVGALVFQNFVKNSIPELDGYCQKRVSCFDFNGLILVWRSMDQDQGKGAIQTDPRDFLN